MPAGGRTVGIIGGGISGLAWADVLGRAGFATRVYERGARVGGVWAHAYPGVTLQNFAAQYHFADLPWPFEPEFHPTGEQVRRYLDAAVEQRRLDVRLRHEVVSARAEGDGWHLRVRGPDGAEGEERVDRLVVSIGQYTEGKVRPRLPGEETFAGEVVTEREMRDLDRFADKRVVVVGFGKTALDMACLAVARGAEVRHVFRTARWALPRSVFGVHISRLMVNRIGTTVMPSWAHPTAPERALHRMRPLIRGIFAGLQRVIVAIMRRAARGHGPEGAARIATILPDHALLPDLRSALPLAPDGYFPAVASGAIRPVRGELDRLTPDGVQLRGGEILPADRVLLCFGTHAPAFPFFDAPTRALLEGEPDGVQLYRHLIHPRLPGLAFAGYNHGFMHIPAAELGALWTAAVWRGEMTLPPVAEMEAAVEHIRAWKRENIHFEPSRACAVNTRYQQYLDILLGDLGISPYRKLPNVFAELFARYVAGDYAGVVDAYLRAPPKAPRTPLPLPT